MRKEYAAIVDAGLILQIDDPRLLTYYISRPDLTVEDCRRWAEIRVEALNHALSGLPEDRIRFHTCYGINIGPRVHEMNLADIVDIMMKVILPELTCLKPPTLATSTNGKSGRT